MRQEQKQQAEDFVKLLGQAHEEIKKSIDAKNEPAAMGLLAQCQEGAIQLGSLIEATEGEGAATIPMLESYCEFVYEIYGELAQAENGQRLNGGKIYKKLRNALFRIESSIRNDIKVRLEIVFLPYKASMWDSLESVWQAADADPDCDAYVVPIPYYDRNSDGSLGAYHYEGSDFPSYVPITYFETYELEKRKPDVAYIHNPYDQGNYVTTVAPGFYSGELKKHVHKLVYIPYYITTGGMAEAQLRCIGYYNADYIVIQSEKYRKFFAPELPDQKFLPFGSPKADRILRMCAKPGPLPEAWRSRMEGRKVYFYNTSINGMLENTPRFLEKMSYVFRCFQGREDVCLLWRPHPLLESTLDSLRPRFRVFYDRLKEFFRFCDLGIYDDTPDITETISHCDAYLGDSATSVVSLFGMAGKPLFILNNYIDSEPEEGDWRGEIIPEFQTDGQDKWMITQGNKLYWSPKNDYSYQYYCDLSEYASGGYYIRAFEIGEHVYICPGCAQEILVVTGGQVERRIILEHYLEQPGAFAMAWRIGSRLILVPLQYPAIVIYDVEQDTVEYVKGCNDIFVDNENGIWRVGGTCVWKEYLLLASPKDNRILAIDSRTGKTGLLSTGIKDSGGCIAMCFDGREMWLLPYSGGRITRWNPESGEAVVYGKLPEDFACKELPKGNESSERPFSGAAFDRKYVYLSPYWGNMFVRLDRDTGEMQEWKPPFPEQETEKNGYFCSWYRGMFLPGGKDCGEWTCRYFSAFDRKLYDVNPDSREYQEVEVAFDVEELRAHNAGFCENSDWLKYACEENFFNSLKHFLDGDICGESFDKERQLKAYREITANYDGSCGEKVHRFVCRSLER